MLDKNRIKKILFSLFPTFKLYWANNGDLQIDKNKSYTYHGLFLVFSWYFREHFSSFSDEQLKKLFSYIESWEVEETASVADWQKNRVDETQQLANAVFTCFLEGIAGNGLSPKIKAYMGEKTRKYYELYD